MVKSKRATFNLNQVIRKVAVENFKNKSNQNSTELIIIITAKDEEKTIGNVIDSINNTKINLSYKIVVVNDGSVDKTEEIGNEKNVIVVNHIHNLGIGGATKTGFLIAKLFQPKIIINIDADGQHDPKYIPEIINKINDGNDLVYASRFASASEYKTNTIRLIGNKFYSKMVSKSAGIDLSDITTGYRGIRFERIKDVFFISETNFAIELALRAAKKGLKIIDIPTKAAARSHGQSQFSKIEKFISYNINALIQIRNSKRKSDWDQYQQL